jgi:hypothetical protein
VRAFLRANGLSVVFLLLFLGTLAGQAVVGWGQFNSTQQAQQLGTVTFGRYVTSADFAVDVTENWQSEYLQFLVYIMLTVWLVQKGSTESKPPGDEGLGSDQDQHLGRFTSPDSPRWARVGGWRTWTYSWSLMLLMVAVFAGSWATQLVAGWASYNETRLEQLQNPVALGRYLVDPDFWSRTLQNWQSEFLAVGSMAIFTVYLRQRGSSQSKPVGESHHVTGG